MFSGYYSKPSRCSLVQIQTGFRQTYHILYYYLLINKTFEHAYNIPPDVIVS